MLNFGAYGGVMLNVANFPATKIMEVMELAAKSRAAIHEGQSVEDAYVCLVVKRKSGEHYFMISFFGFAEHGDKAWKRALKHATKLSGEMGVAVRQKRAPDFRPEKTSDEPTSGDFSPVRVRENGSGVPRERASDVRSPAGRDESLFDDYDPVPVREDRLRRVGRF